MIFNRSLALARLPILLATSVRCSPLVWDHHAQLYKKSTGRTRTLFMFYGVGNIFVRFMLVILHVESIYHGHATLDEIGLCLVYFLMYALAPMLQIGIILQLDLVIYACNQTVVANKKIVRRFRLNGDEPDGTEKLIIGLQVGSVLILLLIVPTVGLALQQYDGIFYNVRFNTLGPNLLLGLVAAYGVCGDLLLACFFLAGVLSYIRSTCNWMELITWRESKHAGKPFKLRRALYTYRENAVAHGVFAAADEYLLPLTHLVLAAFLISIIVALVYMNKSLGLVIGSLYSFGLIFVLGLFRMICGATKNYIGKSQEFITSHLNRSHGVGRANRGTFCSMRPLRVKVKWLFEYNRMTFPNGVQNVILARVIDVLLAFMARKAHLYEFTGVFN